MRRRARPAFAAAAWRRRMALGLAALPLLVACNRGGAPGPYAKAPVVLISIDTLRSDHLPAYGYAGVATPAIDGLREDAVLFSRVYSNVPLTLPSHSSILSGELPGHHGVRDNSGYRFRADKVPYLPALLQKAGYATGGAVSAFVLRAETGLSTGFDFYDSSIDVRIVESLGNSQRSGRQTLKAALAWLDEEPASGKPPFLFVHLYEPHTPYAPEEPFKTRYAANPYDGEIATADAIVGELLQALKSRGLYDRAVVVLLSDHGEGLREHGEQEHGIFLYREALQVPLLVKLPGAERGGTTLDTPAELVDVTPTILALLGLPLPTGLDGAPLFGPGPPADRALYAETNYPRLHFGWSDLASVIRGGSHYIEGPAPELYDLGKDPGERTNVLEQERRTYAALKAEVATHRVALAAPAQEDAETARQLAALGYVSGNVAATSGPLPDPKSQIHTLDLFGQAMRLYSEQRYAEAVPMLQQAVASNPKMTDAWENLAQGLHKLGRDQEALAAYQRGIETSGGASHLMLGTASLLLDMGRIDEAEKHAKVGVEDSPAVAHDLLAKVALARHDLDGAEREAKIAVGARGSRVGPMLTMATIQQARGDDQGALRTVEQAAAELDPTVHFPGLHMLRGDLLARLGRVEEAEGEFREEIAEFPADGNAYSRLAVLYASLGQPQQALDALRALVDGQRTPAAYATAVKTLRILGDSQSAAALLQHALTVYPQSPELKALAG